MRGEIVVSEMIQLVLEFHDSDLVSIEQGLDSVTIEVLGYIRRCEGGHGDKTETGWQQMVTIELRGDPRVAQLPDLPTMTIAEGEVVVDKQRWKHVVPVPVDYEGESRVVLVGTSGALIVSGNHLAIKPHGEARFVESC